MLIQDFSILYLFKKKKTCLVSTLVTVIGHRHETRNSNSMKQMK